MYKGVVIDAFGVYYTKLILKRPPQERYGYFQYGVTITRLTLAADYKEMVQVFNSKRSKATQLRSSDIEFSKKEIITLLEALPNLEYLNMNASMNLQKYLNCILKTDSKKCLTRIQHIPPSKNTQMNRDSADRTLYKINSLSST
ncbi:uncharacterized protein EV154DRAFT_567940 [Mucor mucedo]|uniref:uncharacterized protein n=1 Tax=Mucor mucedo TaxID=29922 RepID=UPI002221043D|nr:uncharacterized protein EV154DRAFT_567940 [Mucor mucedo]KAI7884487.1 hypothetical protein EV154DRAFT_567940 [Mucor mucedo]